ncbi:hypothetical protein [Rhodovulum marinum]|uniref:Dolichyl-phosphate-mannose-protein mannosyltransferase n=1 Tax=Rhodovulum marinum TaxID=320662 RepID=A0A4R2PU14_9RHOB|nr:hypothetical protein [Rhodovulum marinum]TCP39523.1 hypothetical protein EV662_1113 [Rhodovulum marinum]
MSSHWTDRLLPPPLLLSISFLVLFALQFVFVLRFADNDDIVMQTIVSGFWNGEPSAFTVFMNYYLGFGLAVLYDLVPFLDWYTAFFFVIYGLCLYAGLRVLVEAARRRDPPLAAAGGLILFVIILNVQALQFTTLAASAICCAALAYTFGRGRWDGAIALILLPIAFLIRFEAAVLVSLIFLVFLAVSAVLNTTAFPARKAFVGLAGLLILATLAETASNRAMIAADADYVAFNAARGQINDNKNVDLDRITLPPDMTRDELVMLVNFLPDPSSYTAEDLQQVVAQVSQNMIRSLTPERLAGNLYMLVTWAELTGVLILLAGATLCSGSLPRTAPVLMAVGSLFVLLLYVSITAVVKERVVYAGMLAILVCFAIWAGQPHFGRWRSVALLLSYIPLSAALLVEGNQKTLEAAQLQATFEAGTKLVDAWPGKIIPYRGHYEMEGQRVHWGRSLYLPDNLALSAWFAGHPDNPAYRGLSDLLDPGTVMFLKNDAGREVRNAILSELEHRTGRRITEDMVARNETAMLLRFVPEG